MGVFRWGRSRRDGEDVAWRLWVVRWYVVDTGVFHQTVGTLDSICTLRDVGFLLMAGSSIESPVEKT